MKVRSLMSSNVVTVEMDDPISTVKEIFDNTKFHHLLVVEGEKLQGVISDRDLLKVLSPNIDRVAATDKDFACLNKKAHQIMSRKPITVSISASVSDVIDIFNTHTISCIPVVNDKDEPVGIISWRDIMREIGRRINKSSESDSSSN